ncbi:MAG: glutathione peroxidase [Spirochaetes bacterium]|nr:glutathione peroxidase [Spirochaetota bacterium]
MDGRIHDFSAKDIKGRETSLSKFKGKVVLVVNTASKCGFTPQFRGLQDLYDRYGPRGFVVLGFPCNQFAGQEPGDEGEIASFCSLNYGVTFPMFARVEVNGPGTHPLFAWLKARKRGLFGSGDIKWNFTKFLVGRDGLPLWRFPSSAEPETLASAIEKAIDLPA